MRFFILEVNFVSKEKKFDIFQIYFSQSVFDWSWQGLPLVQPMVR